MEQASVAAQVEVTSQIETWGEVEDSTFAFYFSQRHALIVFSIAHDVDERDVRRQLGSVACILVNS